MIKVISNKLIDYLDKGNYLKEDKVIYLYGAKLIISEFIGTSILLLMGLVTKHFIEAIMYEIILSSTRSILGGYHCKSYTACICTYVGFFLTGLLLLKYFSFNSAITLIVCFAGAVNILILAPVENKNKIANSKKRKVFKRYSRIILLVYLITIFTLFHFCNRYLDMIVYIFIVTNLLMLGGKIDYERTER